MMVSGVVVGVGDVTVVMLLSWDAVCWSLS